MVRFSRPIAALSVMAMAVSAQAEPLTPSMRALFRANIAKGCMQKISSDPQAQKNPDAYRRMCDCSADRVAQSLTLEEMEAAIPAHNFNDATLDKVAAAGESCKREILGNGK